MKRIISFLLLLSIVSLSLILSSCDSFSQPIETGTDTDGVDAYIDWMHDADAYPSYGVDNQRTKHYYTHKVTLDEITTYINELSSIGYALNTEINPHLTSLDEVIAAFDEPYEGLEVKFSMVRGEDSLILEYVYIGGETWTSEIDS